MARHRVVDLALRSHGARILEQLVVLDAAQRLATEKGLRITQADVDGEYDRALRRLTDPLSTITPGSFDRENAERLLGMVLAKRNVSREEFLLSVRRNAFLRKIVESQQRLTEKQLRAEYERLYGKRVQVRHIQLASSAEVARVQERLAAGADFGRLARRYSANEASARDDGILEPFSERDERVPSLLREVAFSLEPGAVSGAVRIGDWYHFVQQIQLLPARQIDFQHAREELERSLRDRLTEPAMGRLYEKLFREVAIEVYDPVLREAFEQRYPGRLR